MGSEIIDQVKYRESFAFRGIIGKVEGQETKSDNLELDVHITSIFIFNTDPKSQGIVPVETQTNYDHNMPAEPQNTQPEEIDGMAPGDKENGVKYA